MAETWYITTSLARLRAANACEDGMATLIGSLPADWGEEQEINLLHIMESNGVEHCLWALRATVQDCAVPARLIACDCAERVIPIWETSYPNDPRPQHAIETSRRYAAGQATRKELDAAGAAAWDAAWDAELEAQAAIIRRYLRSEL